MTQNFLICKKKTLNGHHASNATEQLQLNSVRRKFDTVIQNYSYLLHTSNVYDNNSDKNVRVTISSIYRNI